MPQDQMPQPQDAYSRAFRAISYMVVCPGWPSEYAEDYPAARMSRSTVAALMERPHADNRRWAHELRSCIDEMRRDAKQAHEARKEAQAEAAALKGMLAAARVNLRRELLQLGWVPPAPTAVNTEAQRAA